MICSNFLFSKIIVSLRKLTCTLPAYVETLAMMIIVVNNCHPGVPDYVSAVFSEVH